MRFKQGILTWFIPLLLLSGCGDFAPNIFSKEEDAALGLQFAEQIYADPGQFPILDSAAFPEAYQRLGRITEKILGSGQILHRDEFAWKIHIVDDDSVLNAFCTPGGYIFVYTGLIRFLESEDQLAGVLGHEIAHADLRHSTEQITKNMGVRIVTQLIAGDAATLANVADQLLQLGFSRSDETEADLKSVEYLYDTDYDPRGVARFFERMEKGSNGIAFLSTHPDPENRVQKIMEHWKLLGSRTGKSYEKEYRKLVASLP
jgi:predicted Zn-dependent protease